MPTNDTSSRADPEPASGGTQAVFPYPMLGGESYTGYFNRLLGRHIQELGAFSLPQLGEA